VPEMMFRSEYMEGNRTAQVLWNMTTKKYSVYCFCCGQEAESEPFDTEQAAEDFAEDFVQKTIELPQFQTEEHKGCCGD